MGGLERAKEGLAFVFVDEVSCDGGVVRREGVGLHEEIEDRRQDGHGGCVCFDIDAWEMRVAKNYRDAEVADMWIVVGSGHFGVFFECLAAAMG